MGTINVGGKDYEVDEEGYLVLNTGYAAIDPNHIEFKFSGEDAYGYKMDPKHDQFMGFSGIA